MKIQSFASLLTISMMHAGLYAQQNLEVQVQRAPIEKEVYYHDHRNVKVHGQPAQVDTEYHERVQALPPGGRVNIQESRRVTPESTESGSPMNMRKSYPVESRTEYQETRSVQYNNQPVPVQERQVQERQVQDRQVNVVNRVVQRPINQVQQTLSIIKPDAVEANHIGEIISRFESSGLRVVGIKMMRLNKHQASKFYQVHRDRPFYSTA